VALVSLTAFEALAVTTAMPVIVQALDGLALYALAFGAPLATAIVGMVLAGGWADARGPAGPLRAGTFIFTLGLLLSGLATSMPVLLLGRFVHGLGAGLLGVALTVVVARCYPEHLRPAVFAGFAAAWVLPSIVGPAVSGLVVEHAGWRWVFLGVAVVAPLSAVPVLSRLRRTSLPDPEAAAARPASVDGSTGTAGDVRHAVLSGRLGWALGTGTAVGLLQVAGHGRGVASLASVLVALALLAVSAPRLLPAGTFRAVRGLPSVVAVRGAAAASFMGAEVFLPLVLVRERGLSASTAGLVLTVGAVGWSTGSWIQGRLPAPQVRARLLRAGMLSLVGGIAAALLLVLLHGPTVLLVATWAGAGLGMGLVVPILSILALELSAPEEQGTNSSSLQISDALFSTLALAVAGAIFAALLTVAPLAPYLGGFGVALAAALGGALLAARARA
jgi:MFS family permease